MDSIHMISINVDIINILAYFALYSFLGWIIESVFKTMLEKKWVNSGFLEGPFCPIYGAGSIIMYIGLEGFRDNPILVFVLSFIILSIWEYFVGWVLEKIFNTKYWDYSENKFNIKGRICLMNSVFWGILGTVFIYMVHPITEKAMLYIPRDILFYILIIVYILLLIDTIISTIKVKTITLNIKKIQELGELIKEKVDNLEKIKSLGAESKQKIETLQKAIDKLKLKQHRLREDLYKLANRLKKAFPTMKSEIVTQALNYKNKILNRNKKTKE